MGFFLIEELSHMYRGLDPLVPAGGYVVRGAGACNLDVMCYPDWHPLHNATARIYFVDGAYGYLCSGTLLNTEAGDETPYFMTANHCVSSDSVAATVTARWFYQTLSCNGSPGGSSQSSNADVRATSSSYDQSLLMVNGALPGGATYQDGDLDGDGDVDLSDLGGLLAVYGTTCP